MNYPINIHTVNYDNINCSWMTEAEDRTKRRVTGQAYVQPWTAVG